jgi:hypothetical protein
MNFLAKHRATEAFCRTHPGQAFDEGSFGRTTSGPVTTEGIDYVFNHLWARGREELKLLGWPTPEDARYAAHYFAGRSLKTSMFCNPDGDAVLVSGIIRPKGELPVTWFQATEEFQRYARPITKLMRSEIASFREPLEVYSLCVHPDTERWFRLLGFTRVGQVPLWEGVVSQKFRRNA